jgi:hypothetical protein
MCRSIVRLRDHDEVVGDDEIRAAALQFVRKISGYRQPAKKNEEAFEAAVAEIADSSHRLLHAITGHPQGDAQPSRLARAG